MNPLHVAISPCPNDTFIFGAWILGLGIPMAKDARFHWHDVQELNSGAFHDQWDIVKVSAATALRLRNFTILRCGGAFGLEHGPKLVTLPSFKGRPKTIAVPGLDTTAMRILGEAFAGEFTPVPMIFHAIVNAVQSGQTDAGLLIHETALVHERHGLSLHLDLGAWWRERTGGLPLPLGCIVAKNALGAAMHAEVERRIQASIHHARTFPESVMPLIASLARELDAPTLEQHIAAYVNDFSLDMGHEGTSALNILQTFRTFS